MEENPKINEIYLHLDNDEVGRNATETLQIVLGKEYKVVDNPVPYGKDCNDYLCYMLGLKNFIKFAKQKNRKLEKVI